MDLRKTSVMTIPEEPPRSLRLRIDREALASNWRVLDRLSGNAQTGAAVKADAYGIGVDAAVPTLRDAGAAEFFVAHWSEVAPLLDHVEGSAISVLHGVASEEECTFARATGAIPVINSLQQAQIWTESGGGPCHLMVDSGINRLGIAPHDISDPAIQALSVDVMMSHLASADEDSSQNTRQLAIFQEVVQAANAKRFSLCNSAGIMLGEAYHFDLTRPGLALYGGIAHADLTGQIMQVAFPEAAIIQCRNLSAGDAVGYNATWTATEDTRTAVIALGYADGLLRQMGAGIALQHGTDRFPVIGRVSMDMIVIDLANSDVKEGDFLSLQLDLPEISQRCDLSQYEILTSLGQRFKRS